MDYSFYVEDSRLRLAGNLAMHVLAHAALMPVPLRTDLLGSVVAAFLPLESPEMRRAWSEFTVAQAIRASKDNLLRSMLADHAAHTGGQADQALPEHEIDCLYGIIGETVLVSFFKFLAIKDLYPDWYTPYLETTRID